MFPLGLDLATTATASLTRSALPDAPVVRDVPPSTSRAVPRRTGSPSAWQVLLRLLAMTAQAGPRRWAHR